MNAKQKLVSKTTEALLKNEDWMYGKRRTSFYRMRKFVKKQELV